MRRPPRHRQIGQIVVVDAEVLGLGRHPGGRDRVRVREHRPLRAPGGPRGVADERELVRHALLDLRFEEARMLPVKLPPELLNLLEGLEPVVTVVEHAARVVVDDEAEGRELRAEGEHLVDLLLVLGDDHGDLGVIPGVRELLRDRVLVDGHRDATEGLRGDLGPVEARAVVADDRELLAAPHAERRQAEREVPHLGAGLRPRPRLPDAAVLLAERGASREVARVAHQEARQRRRSLRSHVTSPGHRTASSPLPSRPPERSFVSPRYALMTRAFARTSSGVPSAIFWPMSRTAMRSEMSMTTPMSCSMRMIVVPHSSLTSRMKRAMSSFSSWLQPPIGSSSRSTLGSSASARPSSTRFCSPYASEPVGRRRRSWILRKSMMSSTRLRWATSSFCASPQYTNDDSTPDFMCTCRPSMRLSSTVIPRNSAMF